MRPRRGPTPPVPASCGQWSPWVEPAASSAAKRGKPLGSGPARSPRRTASRRARSVATRLAPREGGEARSRALGDAHRRAALPPGPRARLHRRYHTSRGSRRTLSAQEERRSTSRARGGPHRRRGRGAGTGSPEVGAFAAQETSMEHGTGTLTGLLVAFVAALVGGEIAQRLKMPAVVGQIAAGVAVGPSALGWLTLSEPLELLSELGAILLLFAVGLETKLVDLRKVGKTALARRRARRGAAVRARRGLGVPLGLSHARRRCSSPPRSSRPRRASPPRCSRSWARSGGRRRGSSSARRSSTTCWRCCSWPSSPRCRRRRAWTC